MNLRFNHYPGWTHWYRLLSWPEQRTFNLMFRSSSAAMTLMTANLTRRFWMILLVVTFLGHFVVVCRSQSLTLQSIFYYSRISLGLFAVTILMASKIKSLSALIFIIRESWWIHFYTQRLILNRWWGWSRLIGIRSPNWRVKIEAGDLGLIHVLSRLDTLPQSLTYQRSPPSLLTF